MGTFGQFLRAYDQGEAKKLYYLYGGNQALIEYGLDLIRERIHPSDLDSVAITASETDAPWDALTDWPMDTAANRLVVIRGTEDIDDWKPFERWGSKIRSSPTHVVLVSSKEDFDKAEPGGKRIAASARVIKCVNVGDDEAALIVQRIYHMPQFVARNIVRKARSVKVAMDTARKLKLLGIPAEERIAVALMPRQADDDFVRALVEGRKGDALDALASVPKSDYGRIIGLLDWKLDNLIRINASSRAGNNFRETVEETHLKSYTVKELKPHARYYDPSRAKSCSAVLRFADQWKYEEGVMEVMVALW